MSIGNDQEYIDYMSQTDHHDDHQQIRHLDYSEYKSRNLDVNDRIESLFDNQFE